MQSGDASITDTEMLPTTADASLYAANEIAARLRVDTRTGLAWSEANHRSKIVGHNELNVNEDEPPWKKYAQQFQNPLILLLLGKCTAMVAVCPSIRALITLVRSLHQAPPWSASSCASSTMPSASPLPSSSS